MLIRFVVENMFSFGEQIEFSMIPNNRLKTLKHHRYAVSDFDILKMASVYGANGAGKSNLIKSILLFQGLVLNKIGLSRIKDAKFKFNDDNDNQSQVLGIEFFQDDIAFYYAIELLENRIATEELYISGLGEKEDELIYERKTDINGETTINFLEAFEKDEKSQLLKSILLEEFVKPNELILMLLSNRDNQYLKKIKIAYKWFDETLNVITPEARPGALPHTIDVDKDFKEYAENIMCSFNLGITELKTDKRDIKEYFGEDNKKEVNEIIKELGTYSNKMIGLRNQVGDEVIIVKEDDKIWAKSIKIGHIGRNNKKADFDLKEESDGTVRLLDLVPAFRDLVINKRVYLVDEIERSIHPLLIKELIQKFSLDAETQGQLIFTTHETNLLDQHFFRRDEIWLAEKNMTGSTDLYSLNDFKEHNTIDIQKGYLAGRYGSIPFLGNLQDLNWHNNDIDE